MKLYHWYSEAMKEYALGDIVVMAVSMKFARENVRSYAKLYVAGGGYRYRADEDRAKFFEQIERDIAGDPQIMPHDVIFISGSE